MKKILRVFVVRHGESIWNHDSKFTGWTDIPLTQKGKKEAIQIANVLHHLDLKPDIYFSSVLNRSIKTANIIKNKLNNDSTIITSWRLNEKHYGRLEGIQRKYIREKYGIHFTNKLRNNYYIKPPIIDINNVFLTKYPIFQNYYYHTIKEGESKENVLERFLPYFQNDILYSLTENKQPIVVTHKHCLRVLLKYYLKLSNKEFDNFSLPNNSILVMNFNKENKKYISHYFIKY